MNAKCSCQNCNGEFEFDVEEFQESARSGDMIYGQEVPCPHCHKETMLYLEAQPAILSPSLAAASASPSQPPGQSPLQSSKESVFFQNGFITVTNARFVVGLKTFAVRGITSVEIVKADPERSGRPFTTSERIAGVALVAMIGLGLVLWLVAGFSFWVVVGFGIVGFVIWHVVYLASIQTKPVFAILLKTAGGEHIAYQSEDRDEIAQIVRALNDSIIAQG
jgi:hypothetical protein